MSIRWGTRTKEADPMLRDSADQLVSLFVIGARGVDDACSETDAALVEPLAKHLHEPLECSGVGLLSVGRIVRL